MSIEHSESATPPSDRIGHVIAGKYRLESAIGAGGMGVVYKAYREDLQSYVALKLLRPMFMSDPQIAARFLQEARTAAGLKSPHVARVQDFGVIADDPSGARPYIVMEYLTGEDLSEVLKAGALSVGEAVDYVIQACHAIAEAHSHGIVHRDLKPANLFRHDQTGIKVLDFGIAKPGEALVSRLTHAGLSIGSPHYMSPEQIERPRHVDGRADIYSFGVCLYELLTCRVPFKGETYGELMTDIMRGEPYRLDRLRADLPYGLADVVHQAFARDASRRFLRIEELVGALAPYSLPRSRHLVELLATAPLSPTTPTDFVMPLRSTPPVVTSLAGSDTPAPEVPPPQRRKRGWLWASAALLVLLLVAASSQRLSSPSASSAVQSPASGASLPPPQPNPFVAPPEAQLVVPEAKLASLSPSAGAPEAAPAKPKRVLPSGAKHAPVLLTTAPKLNLDSRARQ